MEVQVIDYLSGGTAIIHLDSPTALESSLVGHLTHCQKQPTGSFGVVQMNSSFLQTSFSGSPFAMEQKRQSSFIRQV
jgi:hypothetical protein